MNKWTVFAAIAAAGLASVAIIYLNRNSSAGASSRDTTTTTSPVSGDSGTFCTPQDVQALIAFTVGPESIKGTFTISDTSGRTCQIIGDAFVKPVYDTVGIRNIDITHESSPSAAVYQLAPNDSVTASISFPAGQQCIRGIQVTKTSYTYQLSPTQTVTFRDIRGTDAFGVTTCASPADITRIDISGFTSIPPSS